MTSDSSRNVGRTSPSRSTPRLKRSRERCLWLGTMASRRQVIVVAVVGLVSADEVKGVKAGAEAAVQEVRAALPLPAPASDVEGRGWTAGSIESIAVCSSTLCLLLLELATQASLQRGSLGTIKRIRLQKGAEGYRMRR